MNELSLESSPYLLQHAGNPVHWKAWNQNALSLAAQNNKLIIISVGYSACHWCHVMEHETFENEEAAAVMNAYFVSIKVDREERPDIDAVYMKAVQIMTGQGGWPMNVVALPDGRPVWGGTYFRKNEWIGTLTQLQQLYSSNPEKMIDYAQKLQSALETLNSIPLAAHQKSVQPDLLRTLVEKWKKSFDWEYGGMARAPKFMMPGNYKFLMRYGHQYADKKLLQFVDLTLTRMAYGGLFDTVGGGFSRYSVDMKWHVPHFEKMLYDNGQLMSLYADAFKRTQNPLYREIVEKTLDFVASEWLTPEGAFFSAIDADSLNHKGQLEEGAFYVWTLHELQQLLGTDFDLFSAVFNVNEYGFWEKEHYVLIQKQPIETMAKEFGIDTETLRIKKRSWEQTLNQARQKRSKPRLDDKSLTSWNALMLKGYVDAFKALKNETYLEIALKNANFLISKQWSPDGHLWHSYKNGKSTINGFLEDYALVIEAFIALYEVTFSEKWLTDAKQLADYCFEHFYDSRQQFFSFTSKRDDALVERHFETEDNVIPTSNSVMAENLWRLGLYFNNSHYENVSKKMAELILPSADYPSAFSNWLSLLLQQSTGKELAICGIDSVTYNSKINGQYLPEVIVAGCTTPSNLPFLQQRFVSEKTHFYICQNKSCGLPETNFEATLNALQS